MIRKLSIILCMCLFLFACQQDKPLPDYFGNKQPAREYTRSEEFAVTISSGDMERENLREDGGLNREMRDRALKEGMELVLRKFVNDGFLLRGGTDDSMSPADVDFMDFSGSIEPKKAPVTGDRTQKFRLNAKMVPDWKLIGKIVKLEDDRYVASRGDRCTIVPIEYCPQEPPAYFLVAQPVREMGKRMLRVIGSGKLTHATHDSRVTVDGTYTGNIVQVELLETSEEVMKGDVVIWLQAELTALPGEVTPFEPTDIPDVEEVIVEPEFRETQKGPAETK